MLGQQSLQYTHARATGEGGRQLAGQNPASGAGERLHRHDRARPESLYYVGNDVPAYQHGNMLQQSSKCGNKSMDCLYARGDA